MQPNYSSGTKRVFVVAEAYAKHYRRRNVHTEHIMMALLIERNSGCEILKTLGVDVKELLARFNSNCDMGRTIIEGPIKRSEHADHVIAVANEQRQAFHDKELDTRHLLLGILMGDEGLTADLMAEAGVTAEQVRKIMESTDEGEHRKHFRPRKHTKKRTIWNFWRPA